MTRSAKAQRQHRIAKLLEHHRLGSQGEVVELLAADGVVATQATVSRDLEELGAVKVRAPGGETVYAVPGIGYYVTTAVSQNATDFPVVQGVVIIVATALVFINILVDVAYGWLDPRIRYS